MPPAPIARRLLHWYRRHGRTSLPWQHQNAYKTWVAEIMLQQTRVATVIPYYNKFIARFPDPRALANATQDELLHHWSGLGYYARARNLHAAARQIVADHGGELPRQIDHLIALPGVGRSTAGAILAFAYGQRQPILDGNVKRVLARHHAIGGVPSAARTALLWQLAAALTPKTRIAEYTQAMMDLGATLCTRSRPDCPACPLAATCAAHASGTTAAYPAAAPKPVRPRKTVTMLIIRHRRAPQKLLLVKRPPVGIWGGLWSLPEIAARPRAATVERWFLRSHGFAVKTARALPAVRHAFTHFDLDIHPLPATPTDGFGYVMDAAEYLWYNPSRPARVGLPAVVSRILTA